MIALKLEFSGKGFEKYPNMKFHENPSNGRQVVWCGQTDGRTDMTKLAVAFRNFAKKPKNLQIHVAFDHRQKYLKCFEKFVPKVRALNVNSVWLVHHCKSQYYCGMVKHSYIHSVWPVIAETYWLHVLCGKLIWTLKSSGIWQCADW
jgi:hypothetical protein